MPKDEVNEATCREWRELGFFYTRDDKTKEWLVSGSRDNLLKFARIISDYSENPKNQQLSEHENLGPYMYFEIGTWDKATIDEHWIAGTVEDLKHLSTQINERVFKAKEGDFLKFRARYSPDSPYELLLELRGDDFDPASADEVC